MSAMSKHDYTRYWNGLVAFMRAQNFLPDDWNKTISDTTRQRIYTFPATGDELRISAGASPGLASESPYIQVDLTANPKADAKAMFMNLYQQRGIINSEINSDPPVRWDIRGEKEESWARTRRYAVPQEESTWRIQYEWLAPTLFAFNEAIRTRL